MKISVVSGGFDPIHSGPVSSIHSAGGFGEFLIVALNSDEWFGACSGAAFMPFLGGDSVFGFIVSVDGVIDFVDDGKGSCIDALKGIWF
jgi:ADP-heptose synthase, bifunctional sugar kinase/adenylyltransferase